MSTKPEFYMNEITLPSEVSITKQENLITTKGSFGSVQKDFTKMPAIIDLQDNKITIKSQGNRKKDFALVNTLQSVINNMIKGSSQGFTYRLKIVFAHFPISIKIKGKDIVVENFFGERSPRTSKIIGNDTKVSVEGEDIIVKGPNIENVSQTAANLELATRIKNKDSRVFLDGVYIYSKE
ncbi:MAG TPA: 50S ribosomal protein L6 [Candidatus Nitrosocosmicus sp.]|nr:50S ribosomal protein L6 [Candidatus Nitrosocosmicus sp.]